MAENRNPLQQHATAAHMAVEARGHGNRGKYA